MSEEFVADYIQKCIQNGAQCPLDMRKCAKKEIEEIDKEIKKIELLKNKQRNLRAVIRHLGGNIRYRQPPEKTMDFSIPWDKLNDSFRDICVSICLFIEENGEDKMPSDIMDAISRDQRLIYSAIKWLCYNEVIGRKETDCGRAVTKGSKWQQFMDGMSEK